MREGHAEEKFVSGSSVAIEIIGGAGAESVAYAARGFGGLHPAVGVAGHSGGYLLLPRRLPGGEGEGGKGRRTSCRACGPQKPQFFVRLEQREVLLASARPTVKVPTLKVVQGFNVLMIEQAWQTVQLSWPKSREPGAATSLGRSARSRGGALV